MGGQRDQGRNLRDIPPVNRSSLTWSRAVGRGNPIILEAPKNAPKRGSFALNTSNPFAHLHAA